MMHRTKLVLLALTALLLAACPTLPEPRPDVEKVRSDHDEADRDMDRERAKRKDSND